MKPTDGQTRATADSAAFPQGSGEMAALIRSFDWSGTPLGPIAQWPQSLKTATGLLIASPVPIVMLWGPDGVMIYNDAYSVFAGKRHPELLGSKVLEGWPEVAEFNANVMRVGLAGGTLAYKDQELILHRSGRPEQVWMDLDYWPVPGDDGQPAGVIATVVETTDRVRADRRLSGERVRQKALIQLGDALRDLTDAQEIAYASSRVLAEALGVSRAGYGVIDTEAETITIERDYNAPGVHSLAGTLQFRDYGSYIEDIKRGVTVSISDVDVDHRTQAGAEALKAISAASLINMPLMEQGRVVALVFANHAQPRAWSQSDIVLMREIAERVRDATERAVAAAALRESEARFRNMADNTPMMMWVTDPSGYCTYLNRTWYDFTGQTEGEAEGFGWLDATHPEDKARAEAIFTTANAAREPFRVEYRLRRADGVYRWAIDAASPRFNEAGEYLGYVGSVVDIDERREMEDALRAHRQELERLNAQLEVLLAGSKAERDRLWTLSEDMLARANYGGGMTAVNPAWTKVLGWSEQELLSNPYADIIHPDNVPTVVAALEEMGRTGQPTRFENRILTKDDEWKPIGWTVSPEEDGTHFIAIGRDLTEDKAREKELAATHEALRQSQKMEAVGHLTGGIAHDFNNLLAGISGSLELLEKRVGEGRLSGVDRYIGAAQGAARRAASLTQRLLAFSRRQTLDPKPTDVNRLIGGMEDLIRRSVGPNVEVEVVGAGGLWATQIDQSQLENALLNLCINSRDAMAPDGGRLTIETANKWLDERGARDRDLPTGQYVSLCVTDTGTGMSPDVQAQAFDPFFTTKPLGQGTGLGLSMIHGFVRQSGGQVRIYSEVGKGTTMCLYLPRFTGDLDAVDLPAEAVGEDGGQGEVVLVIDDEPTVRMLVVEVLEDAGYTVIEAVDGPSGLTVLRSDARIDLLVTDVGLPGGMNGRQVADAARADRPDLKVLFMTGYAENAAVGNGLLEPGMQVLTKPFVMAALGAKVREMIEAP
ncbi:PAS domain S-box protein [Brevundimonas sp. Root1279]|uniref:PAS domain S-box protein n=1 Tax=Brevundimonas sp. Root1279 TaxID=1736443 RepID=UPI000ABE79CB|nr:PAS domain S-box protein [Brevundimonas sp. Root1279]